MIEPLILAHLVRDESYANKVLPFLKKEYFTSPAAQEIFTLTESFVQQYKVLPTFDAVELALKNSHVAGNLFVDCEKLLKQLAAVDRVDPSRRKWLVDESEKFVQSRAIYLALSESISRLDKGPTEAATVPALLTDAVAINFDTHIGHDYIEDVSARYDTNHAQGNRLPFDIELFNKITNGGLLPKTLNVVVSGCVHPETQVRVRIRPK